MAFNLSEKRKKLEAQIEALDNTVSIRKELILSELKIQDVADQLNFKHSEVEHLKNGTLKKEKSKAVWELIGKVPAKVRERRLADKRFRIYLLENGISVQEACKEIGITDNLLRGILKERLANRQRDIEKKIEKFCGMNLFD